MLTACNWLQIPVGVSISVTWISAITMITFPVETYLYGLVNAWYCFVPFLANIFQCLFYIPLVHDLKLGSIYEVIFCNLKNCSFSEADLGGPECPDFPPPPFLSLQSKKLL